MSNHYVFGVSDVETLFRFFKDGVKDNAIGRITGYNVYTVSHYRKFYNAIQDKNYAAAYSCRVSNKIKLWAIRTGLLPAKIGNEREPEPEPEQVPLVVGTKVEDFLRSEEEPVPQKPQDYTLSGLDALWRELTALNMRMDALTKTLDTMTNSLVIELNAINKGIDKLAERWQ